MDQWSIDSVRNEGGLFESPKTPPLTIPLDDPMHSLTVTYVFVTFPRSYHTAKSSLKEPPLPISYHNSYSRKQEHKPTSLSQAV